MNIATLVKPPLPYSKNKSLKTQFFQKWKRQEESFININRSIPSKVSVSPRHVKRFSQQFKTHTNMLNSLTGSIKNVRRQKSVPNTKLSRQIPFEKQELQPKKITKIVPQSKLDYQIKTYQWRMSTYFPLVKVACRTSKDLKQNDLNQQRQFQLDLEITWDEDINFKLDQIDQINLLNSLYIIQESLVSFQRLYNRFGFFQPSLKMIMITNSHRCKIWMNEDILQNVPLPPKIKSKQHQKVQYFYKKVIQMFAIFFRSKNQKNNHQYSQRKALNLIQKLTYELQKKTDFVQGMKFIKQFLTAYSLNVHHRFINLILAPQRRQKIFFMLNKPKPVKQSIKINSFADIPIKKIIQKQGQSEIQEESIKTLKNYYNKPTKQVMLSNIKTMIGRKTYSNDKQTQLKKKSQVSISSKQTVVEKKYKFSLHLNKQNPHQKRSPLNTRNLPNFTKEDFNQQKDKISDHKNSKYQKQGQNFKNQPEKVENVDSQEDYQQKIKNQIQKNVREKNGWLEAPLILLEGDECTKSFHDSQPSAKLKISSRNLSKLDKIKSSFANSIDE